MRPYQSTLITLLLHVKTDQRQGPIQTKAKRKIRRKAKRAKKRKRPSPMNQAGPSQARRAKTMQKILPLWSLISLDWNGPHQRQHQRHLSHRLQSNSHTTSHHRVLTRRRAMRRRVERAEAAKCGFRSSAKAPSTYSFPLHLRHQVRRIRSF